jgi:hypothetical protein
MRRRGRALVALVVTLAAIAVAGCGRDDFENEPRPPVPAEISIEVNDETVTVAPAELGAGIANFTIANLGSEPAQVEVEGPTVGESEEIAAGSVDRLKMELTTGDYEASVVEGAATPFEFEVGPERPSAQDELLLP